MSKKTEQERNQTPPPPPYDADLFMKNRDVIILESEFLYWTVEESSLDFAQKMTQPAWNNNPTTPGYAVGKVQTGGFDLDPGFRVTAGYFNAVKYWEARASYTFLISRGKNAAGKPSPALDFLTGTWPQIVPNPLSEAKSHTFFDYNVFDLLVDRVYFTNPHFRMRVLGGGTAAWIKQDWKVLYFDSANNQTTIRNRWHFVGAGLKTGITGDWYWGSNVYFTGEASTAVLMGRYRNRAVQTTNYQPTAIDNPSLPVRDSDYIDTRPAFMAQFSIGPSWQQDWPCQRTELFVGYEIAIWVNLNEIHHSTSGTPSAAKETWVNSSALALHGLTSRFTLNF